MPNIDICPVIYDNIKIVNDNIIKVKKNNDLKEF